MEMSLARDSWPDETERLMKREAEMVTKRAFLSGGGSGVEAASPADVVSPADGALQGLEDRLDRLSAGLAVLRGRLLPVSVPTPEGNEVVTPGGGAHDPGEAPLVSTLVDFCARADRLSDRVSDMIANLQI